MTKEQYIKEAERQGIPNILLHDGQLNTYRAEFVKFRGANTKEKTWNKSKHIHTCCDSKVPWRHRVACPGLNEWGNL